MSWLGWASVAVAYFALALPAAACLALSSTRVVERLRRFNDSRVHGGLLVALLAIPYVLLSLPTAAAQPQAFAGGLARMLAYLCVPSALLLFRPARNRPLDRFDVLAILALWLPVEFDWLPDAGPLAMLTAVCLGFLLFLVIRPVDGLRYTFRLGPRDAGYALIALGAFAVVGLPLGLATAFIQPGFAPFAAGEWLLKFAGIYLLTAVPEELLFRGVIQNLIEQRFGRTWITLAAAAVIFGLSHINNVTAHYGPPNWPYVAMATCAGAAYGWAWRKTGKITGSALTHTLVNFIWGVVFRS